MHKKFYRTLTTLAVSCATLLAVQHAYAQSNEIYGGIGSDGIGAGYGFSPNTYVTVRGEVSGFSFSHSFSAGDLNYDATVKLIHGALYADFFPIPTVVPMHLTAGLIIGGDELDGDATPVGGTYTINGQTVSANGESIHASAKYPTVRPYLGFGFGHHLGAKGFSVAFDAGVAFGRPRVSFDVPADIAAQAGQENVAAEERNLQDKADDFRFYPIVKVAATYRF
ncbi:hypothetical protein [Paraburkholderia solisilvae]|uniref:Outer membrane protein beta-barrel domain-containing protein n=1 Tax=Paraburkholderia solisilvae TaxID=624376 RepID=A0A6J5D4Q3_9BURK|nr:hypothetical protein [Paraburkholderia solisilvae]CAB3748274.1 hypothetical protein LMG29739_00525 [Paraburkholderia solisilvae]